jgi:hypothetical protein
MNEGGVLMKKFLVAFPVALLLSLLLCSTVQADLLAELKDATAVDNVLTKLVHGGTEYFVASGDLVTGTTTRWYVIDSVEYLWPDGDPQPAGTPTVSGTSNPKVGDIGADADNFAFRVPDGSGGWINDISSIDGINFQETIFPFLTDTIFVFERGGNDAGTVQAILADDTLGGALTLTKSGFPYGNTGIDVGGSPAFGYVLTTDVLVKGLRITASGHDALSISTPVPEPATMALLAFGGLLALRRRRA